MPLLSWSDKYSVGIPEFDNQHKRLIDLINSLHEAMSTGRGNAVLDKVLADLITYTQTHFAAEERFMQSHQFGEFAAHKVEHEKLTKRVLDFQQQFRAGKLALSISLMRFLETWLTSHIMDSDRKYGVCLESLLTAR
jgi:hemerythrin